ncbi:MAG: hypothetical protein LH615_00815 [Ferruginibacter sp.]|nr:hypothetical protein [Ferruginibacter sp.]
MPDESVGYKNNFAKPFIILFAFFAITLFAGQYFITRENFFQLLIWQVLLHGFFLFFYYNKEQISIKQIILAAVVLRIGTAFIMPTLSDDVYRFIWDGQLMVHAQNPLLTTPDNYLANLPNSLPDIGYYTKLHSLINHPQFYTCYPPLMQLVFIIAAFIGAKSIIVSIVVIKIIVAFSDCIAIVFLYKILQKLTLDTKLILLYAFNPLVIIEGAGNAHFEVMQVALMLVSIYFILEKKLTLAAIFWGLAIITKLLPLLLLPLLIRYLGLKKGIIFCLISVSFAACSFLPFVSIQTIQTFSQSLNLYFQNFEFNATIYYLAREIGWWVKGYNYISFIGPLLMGIFLLIYAILFFSKKKYSDDSFFLFALIILSLYYFFATTVHPWYIINLLPFALLTNKKYAFVWMAAAFLSYHAYDNPFKENYWVIGFEYCLVLVAIFYSFRKKKLSDNGIV